MSIRLIHLEDTPSTNDHLRGYVTSPDEDMTVCTANFQTAGRGCGTNTWESERGKNLLFSILVHPENVPANQQFVLSMAEALAVKAALDSYTNGIRLKWPNDIYWHDSKLGGTLIETTLSGKNINSCIFGTGINVNQHTFISDAPNPVSLFQILGHEVDRDKLLDEIVSSMTVFMRMITDGRWAEIRQAYARCLYRIGENHKFQLPDGEVKTFLLLGVDDDGRLVLGRHNENGEPTEYRFGFKEIKFII